MKDFLKSFLPKPELQPPPPHPVDEMIARQYDYLSKRYQINCQKESLKNSQKIKLDQHSPEHVYRRKQFKAALPQLEALMRDKYNNPSKHTKPIFTDTLIVRHLLKLISTAPNITLMLNTGAFMEAVHDSRLSDENRISWTDEEIRNAFSDLNKLISSGKTDSITLPELNMFGTAEPPKVTALAERATK